MNFEENDSSHEAQLLQEMRLARNAASSLKVKVAEIRSTNTSIAILVFEGVDDKTVYFHWIRQIDVNFRYEVVLSNGKTQSLRLREMLARDKDDLNDRVLFFVDRDYDVNDDLEDLANIYLTDGYSFENSLVNSVTLENLLNLEFHCHGYSSIRRGITEKFDEIYSCFCNVTRDINFRIYFANRLSVRRTYKLPDKIGKISNVQLLDCIPMDTPVSELVVLEREPELSELRLLEQEFNLLEPKLHFRGKFALLFFGAWLRVLAAERKNPKCQIFQEIMHTNELNVRGEFNLDMISGKSNAPKSLTQFIGKVLDDIARESAEVGMPRGVASS